jgi:8-oxo-dGTP diphosphatase
LISDKAERIIRYQGAIMQGSRVLLIKHQENHGGRSYWVIPGGGLENGESEEECVMREMREETNLEVKVERLLLDEPVDFGRMYKRRKTYLCTPVSGIAAPGYEPEHENSGIYQITEVGWFDLTDRRTWGKEIWEDQITKKLMLALQKVLGYQKI